MMTSADWIGLTGLALVWLLLAVRLPYAQRVGIVRRVLFLIVVYGVVMLPVFGLSLAGWLRGLVGDLSLTSLLLLSVALYARVNPAAPPLWNMRERGALLMFMAALALLLYPFALGLGTLDPYRSGYGGIGLLLMLALLALWSMRRNFVLLPLVITLAVSGWSFNLLESTNVWDYLIDAPLAFYALGATLKALATTWLRKRHATLES